MAGKAIQPGERFGRLVTVGLVHRTSRSGRVRSHWCCLCDCGQEHVVESGNLRNGNTRWCRACASNYKRQHKATHGRSRTRVYNIWCGIKSRVLNPENERFADYGGRGIDMDPRWESSFEAFLEDMGEPPTTAHSIERRDNDKGYWPGNCIWASPHQQAANTRSNHVISALGETHILAEWARRTGIKDATIAMRLRLGWSPDKAVSTPENGTRRKYVWRTPAGAFGTITEAANHHDIALRTASWRFSAASFPEWKREDRNPSLE